MARAFPDSTVSAPTDLKYDYDLTDRNDGHVAHAALVGRADAIVTDDKRAGFKTAGALEEARIEILAAAEFAAKIVAAYSEAGVRAMVALSERRKNPAQAPVQILDLLADRYGMNEVAGIIRPLLADFF